MEIIILGGGAIGCLFGAYLSRGGHRVIIVEPRQDVVEAINAHGVGFMAQGVNDPDAVRRFPARAVLHASEVKQADLVLLAVKSFATREATAAAQHLLERENPLVTLQTGLGNIEQLVTLVGEEVIIPGFTFMAGTALPRGVVRQGGNGKTYIGELDGSMSPRVEKIGAVLAGAGLPCVPVHRILGRLWCKVIIYGPINALSAVLKVRNGQLLESMESIVLLKRLVDEGSRVAAAQGIDLVFTDLYKLLFDACHRTADNLSSMLQDMLSGKPTEIDAQCGALVRFGEAAGVKTPTLETMVELVKLVARYGETPIT